LKLFYPIYILKLRTLNLLTFLLL